IKESSNGISHKYNRTHLNLSGLGIESLGSGFFEHFEELTTLDVSLNDIRFIEDLALYGLRNLRKLDISHNSGLYTLRSKSLLPLEKLEEINLDATHISSLSPSVFRYNPSLRKLSLNTPFTICDCDLQKLVQKFEFDDESICLYPVKLRGVPVKSIKNDAHICKAFSDLEMRVVKTKKARSSGGSYWEVDCSVNDVEGHVIEMKLDGRPLHSHSLDRHHIILHIFDNFVPHHPWICYAEIEGAPDAKAFHVPSSCPEEVIRNGGREVRFPGTPPDTILEIRCPNSSIILPRECSSTGVWSGVDISFCPEVSFPCESKVNETNIDEYLRNAN
ncbi:hypothetical protein PFISCL1PPCAC_27601, partial [Pristionchus fissidentatus]